MQAVISKDRKVDKDLGRTLAGDEGILGAADFVEDEQGGLAVAAGTNRRPEILALV